MVTRTVETCIQYEKKAKALIKDYETANTKKKIEFDIWIRRKITTITKSSWTSYRAALIYSLQNQKVFLSNYSNHDALQQILNLKGLFPKKRSESNASSRKKYKHLPLKTYNNLKLQLQKGTSRYDHVLYHWLRATRATGLRPIEWTTLKIKPDKTFKPVKFTLVINNAKHTNDRSFGKQRTIYIQSTNQIINSIIITWKTITEIYKDGGLDAHNKFYKGCRDRLLYVNSKIGCGGSKKRITLYSARHQFKADMQYQGKTNEQIAALMGHGSIATANTNYAKKRFSRDTKTTITPSESDLNKVIELNKNRNISIPQHIQNKINGKLPSTNIKTSINSNAQ